jgi:hypothetical protein
MSNTNNLLPRKLQGLLYPPSSQIGLLQVLENLQRILKFCPLPIPERILDNTKSLDQVIQNISAACHDRPKLVPTYSVSVNKRLQGSITKHPLWALLYVDNRSSPYIQSLQAAALEAAHGAYSKRLRTHDLQPFGRLIRYMSMQNTSDNVWNFSPNSYNQLKKSVERLIEKNLIDIPVESILSSLRLLKVINNEKVKRLSIANRSKEGLRSSCTKKIIPDGILTILIEGDEDDLNSTEEVLLYTPLEEEKLADIPITDDELAELEESGVEREELEPDFQQIIFNNCIQSESTEFLLEKHKVSAVRNIMARENSALSNSYNLLSDHELMQVHDLIIELQHSEVLTEKKLSLALWVMLITSSKIDDLTSFSVIDDINLFNRNNHALAYIINKKSWCIPTIKPNYKTEEKESPSKNRNTQDDYILLPDEFGLHDLFKDVGLKINELAFEGLDLKKLLKDKLSQFSERITIAKVSRYQLETAKTMFDPVLVQTIFGINISTASARQYYSTVKIREVISSYTLLNKKLADTLDITHYKTKEVFSNHYISARYVANTSDIRTSIKKIEGQLARIPECNIVARHNWFTVKCIFVQSIFTAIRAIRDPFVSLNQLEISDNTLTFHDKSGADFNHVRFQPHHQIIKNIASDYKMHKELVIKRLSNQEQEKFGQMNDETFILTDDMKTLPASPKSLRPFWEKISSYPINSNRKFIKNKLRYLGASQHEIDTVMGHHAEGEAIWSQFNTSSISDIQFSISAAFEKIIEELDIQWGVENA